MPIETRTIVIVAAMRKLSTHGFERTARDIIGFLAIGFIYLIVSIIGRTSQS